MYPPSLAHIHTPEPKRESFVIVFISIAMSVIDLPVDDGMTLKKYAGYTIAALLMSDSPWF